MLESTPVILIVAIVLGFLAGLGVGGGSLLILWLTFALGMEHLQARVLNLLFFLPAAIITSFFRWKKGQLNIRQILPAIIAGCITAWIFSWLSQRIDLDLLKKSFGVLLLITGTRELLHKSNIQKSRR